MPTMLCRHALLVTPVSFPPCCPCPAPPSRQILSNLVTNMTWQLVGKATVGSDIVSGWAAFVSWARWFV